MSPTAGAERALVASTPGAATYADFATNPVAVSAPLALPAPQAATPRSEAGTGLTLAASQLQRDTIPRATAAPQLGLFLPLFFLTFLN